MDRPTVNDIAREAGVSLATVSRVLNARPGVRGRTIAAVNDAVARLGCVRDLAVANLARVRGYRVAVLLPDTAGQFVGIPVAALVSDLPATGRARFVGIDNRAAGRMAGRLMGRFLPEPARVTLLAQSMLRRDSIGRRRGFGEARHARLLRLAPARHRLLSGGARAAPAGPRAWGRQAPWRSCRCPTGSRPSSPCPRRSPRAAP